MESHSTRALDVSLINDPRDFEAMEEEWNELYRNAPLATPFQSWAWLYSWWEFYGEGCQLRIIAVRDGHLLVGLAPLMLERRWGLGRLLFVGVRATGPTDYLDILVRQGWEDGVSEAVVRSLREMGSWQVADLQELRPAAAAWNVFRRWDGPRAHAWQNDCLIVEVRPWEELLAPLSKNLRSTMRRAVRRVEEDGLRCELADLADIERAARQFVALHREAWQGRDVFPANLTQRFALHLQTSARRMAARGLGGIAEFWRDGEVIISVVWIFGQDSVGYYLSGASREALQRYQVSSLYVWSGVNLARERNLPYLDLMRGREPYKLRWNPRIVSNRRALLGRNPIFLFPYVGYRVLRTKARTYADSADAPQWIKRVLDRLRGR
jgi:hypothetical protein